MGTGGKLQDLGQAIMMASVKASFLDFSAVVAYLDMAFDEVVRLALELRESGVEEELMEELVEEG